MQVFWVVVNNLFTLIQVRCLGHCARCFLCCSRPGATEHTAGTQHSRLSHIIGSLWGTMYLLSIQLDLLILWAKGRKGNIARGVQAEVTLCEWRQRGGAGSQGVSQRQTSTVVTSSWGWKHTQPGRVPAGVTSCRPNSRLSGLHHSVAFAQTAFGGCFRDRWHFILAVIYQSHPSKLWLQGNYGMKHQGEPEFHPLLPGYHTPCLQQHCGISSRMLWVCL